MTVCGSPVLQFKAGEFPPSPTGSYYQNAGYLVRLYVRCIFLFTAPCTPPAVPTALDCVHRQVRSNLEGNCYFESWPVLAKGGRRNYVQARSKTIVTNAKTASEWLEGGTWAPALLCPPSTLTPSHCGGHWELVWSKRNGAKWNLWSPAKGSALGSQN